MTARKLLNVVGGKDLETNFRKIAMSMSNISFRYPVPNENILSHGGVYEYPVKSGDIVTKYTIDSTGTSIDSIKAGTTSGCTYKIKPAGTVKKISSDTSTAIFGASTYTNCMLVLIELPTTKYETISVKLGAGSAATLTEENIIMGDDVCYYVLPLGLYDNSGTTTASYSTYEISQNGSSMKNEFDVSGVTLEP